MFRRSPLPLAIGLSLLALAGCKEKETPAADAAAAKPAYESEAQRMGYSLGSQVGRQFRNDKLPIDADALIAGVKDGFASDKLALSDDDILASVQMLQQRHTERVKAEREKQETDNRAAGEAFLANNKTAEGVTTTASGLQYKVITAGTGAKPTAEDTVSVHYRGTLLDGTEFDSSYKRGQPVSFPVGSVIPGWVEALQLMPVGSKWNLWIPADLAYGPGGAGNQIGPNATLAFEVELLAIEKPQAATGE